MSAFAALREVCRLLGRDPLSPLDAAHALGTITEDFGPDMPIELAPASPAFTSGKVLREFGNDAISHVSLVLAEELPIAQVDAELGEGKASYDVSMHAPRLRTYKLRQPELPLDCTLIAELRRRGDSDVMVAVSVRRDSK